MAISISARLAAALAAVSVLGLPAVYAVAQDAAPAKPALTAEQVEKGRKLFADNGCNACHTLADSQAAGSIGPAFDGNPNLNHEFAVDRITNGQGAMPNFGWLPKEDIDLLASYIVQTKK